MGDSTKALVDAIRENVKARIEHLGPDVRADILYAVAEWAVNEAARAAASDPDRIKRATDRGARGLAEPEE